MAQRNIKKGFENSYKGNRTLGNDLTIKKKKFSVIAFEISEIL